MRITMFTQGSRGDVQPMIALASRFKQDGHSVLLATSPDYAELSAEYSVDFAPLGPPLSTFMNEELNKIVESGNMFKILRYGLEQRKKATEILIRDSWKLAQGSDAIIFKGPTVIFGYNIAEKLGVPCAEVEFFPVHKTRAFPSFFLGDGKKHGALLDGTLWNLGEQILWFLMQRGSANKQRREVLNLPVLPFTGVNKRQDREGMPVFYAYSPTVLPKPADWPDRMHVTGYYFSEPPTDWQPPDDLLRFLESGPPPVYIGLGSIPAHKPEETLQMFLQALETSGQRAILASGWSGIGKDFAFPEHVFHVESIPHSWLFPRTAAIVHHGGAGTTAASMRSGVPTIVTPVAADQPSWGERVHTLGVGPAPLPLKKLTAQQLSDALREAVTNTTMRKKAAQLGEQLRSEDGLGQTTHIFYEYAKQFRSRK